MKLGLLPAGGIGTCRKEPYIVIRRAPAQYELIWVECLHDGWRTPAPVGAGAIRAPAPGICLFELRSFVAGAAHVFRLA
jgi:hypothetical protein